MRTKQLFKTRLLSFAAVYSMTLAVVSCANEDIAQNSTGANNDKNLTTFITGTPETRTSMDYSTGAFYWEPGDKIYVKDDTGTFQVSSNSPTSKTAAFKFKVPGKFTDHNSYKVYYIGGSIQAYQRQEEPNNSQHLSNSGDCGLADATKQANGLFSFKLDHQVTILVLQPYTNNTVLNSCYLTKIEVNSDNDIAGYYSIDPVTGDIASVGNGKNINLITIGSNYPKGFPLTNSSADVTTNGSFIVIKSGEHKLRIRYWVKDYTTGVEGTVTKNLNSFDYKANTYYDMTANLNIRKYDGRYYMWDAKENYWSGHEWDSADPWQPTLHSEPANTNYPQNNTDNRWYREDIGPTVTAMYTCASAPNANEFAWYALKGDPHLDADEIWTAMGHLFKGGMWFKKKANIPGFSDAYMPDRGGLDLRNNNIMFTIHATAASDLPTPEEANKYFYLPALGHYRMGKYYGLGGALDTEMRGDYWSSSRTNYSGLAWSMYFNRNEVYVGMGQEFWGMSVLPFE